MAGCAALGIRLPLDGRVYSKGASRAGLRRSVAVAVVGEIRVGGRAQASAAGVVSPANGIAVEIGIGVGNPAVSERNAATVDESPHAVISRWCVLPVPLSGLFRPKVDWL